MSTVVNGIEITSKQEESFRSQFKIGDADSCWLWTGKPRPDGYGRVYIGKKPTTTTGPHRLALAFSTGVDPAGYEVCHSCDTPLCVNPAHLFLGTKTDNMRDCVSKGRHIPMRGEANGKAKLTAEIVIGIRWSHESGEPIKKIARRLGIDHKTVRDIVKRRRWTHV